MAGISLGVGGVWKTMSNLSIGVGGVWKQVAKVSIGVGGVWKDVWTNLAASISSLTVTHGTISPANATAGYQLNTDGSAYRLNGSTWTLVETWKDGSGASSGYECRWTTTSGTLSVGTNATWLPLSSSESWTRTNTTDGFSTQTCVGTLEIRMAAAPNTVLTTATITLEANVEI